MLRRITCFSFALIAVAFAGCTKSEDDFRKAQRATDHLMPDNDPDFEAEYVADQSQVKLVAARNISYEPLDTFRSGTTPASDESDSENEAAPAKPSASTPPRGAPSAGTPAAGGNFWSRVGMKALMGGGAPPAPRTASPGTAEPKSDEPAPPDEATEDQDAATDEEAADADESDDEESDGESDEESDDGDSSDEKPSDSDSDGE